MATKFSVLWRKRSFKKVKSIKIKNKTWQGDGYINSSSGDLYDESDEHLGNFKAGKYIIGQVYSSSLYEIEV